MKRISLFRIIFIIAGIAGLMGAALYLYRVRSPIAFKTNRTQTVISTKKQLAQWLAESAGIYFFHRYLPTWQKGVKPTREQRKEQRKLLNYSLDIEHIIDHDPHNITRHDHPTIFLHGWGDTKESAKLLKAHCDVLPGDMITFNFRDRGMILAKWRYSNLGQLPDVLSLIFVLKWTKETLAPKAIDLFGYSRGGATLLNTLAVLNDTNGTYDAELQRIGITPNDRSNLLQLLQNGSHVLNCPLSDMNMSIGEFMKNRLKSSRAPESWIRAFEKVTQYKHDGLQGINSAQKLTGLTLNMLVHYQYRDGMVSNKNDATLYKQLYKHNPKTTYLVLGNDGGHLHTHAALAHTIHTFKKMFGGSYNPEYADQYNATKHMVHPAHLLKRPGNKADTFITYYYQQCERERNAKKAKQ